MRKTILTSLLFISMFAYSQNADIDRLKNINIKNPSQYWVQTTNSAYWMPAAISLGLIGYAFKNKNSTSRLNAFQTPFSIGFGLSISETIKFIVNRMRPGDQYPNIIFPYNIVHGHSFPSGHTTSAFLLAANLTFQYNKWYVIAPAYLWAASVAWSRMKLGEHFPTDVLGGMIAGTTGAFLSKYLTPKIINSHL